MPKSLNGVPLLEKSWYSRYFVIFFILLLLPILAVHSFLLLTSVFLWFVPLFVNFAPSLSVTLFSFTSPFVLLTLIILNPVRRYLLSATVNH